MILLAGAALSGCTCNKTRQLTQVDPAQVNKKTWVLTSMNGQSVVDDPRVTMELRPSLEDQGRIIGRAQCNNYLGNYRVADNKITFSTVAATKMACSMNLMDKEKEYFDTFSKIDYLRISENKAVLEQKTGDLELTYAAESGVVSGKVITHSGYFSLGSEMIITLRDSTMRHQPEGVISIERVKLGRDVTEGYKYSINYAPQLVKPGRDYELSVQVLHRGQLYYVSKMNPVVKLHAEDVVDAAKMKK